MATISGHVSSRIVRRCCFSRTRKISRVMDETPNAPKANGLQKPEETTKTPDEQVNGPTGSGEKSDQPKEPVQEECGEKPDYSKNGEKSFDRFAKLATTMTVVGNWLMSRSEETKLAKERARKVSITDDPFLLKFSTATTDIQNVDIGNHSTSDNKVLAGIRKFILKPINPTNDFYYYWTFLVATACIYNLVVLIARSAFDDIQNEYFALWVTIDYVSDLIYIVDMFILMKKTYLDQGLMVLIPKKLAINYLRSWAFALDLLSILPTDVLFLAAKYHEPMVRTNRIIRCRRLNEFSDQTETRTNFPNAFRISKMILIIFVVFHVNACIFFELSKLYGVGSDSWVFDYARIVNPIVQCHNANLTDFPNSEDEVITFSEHNNDTETCILLVYSNATRQYLLSFYWSALTLAAIGEQPKPVRNLQLLFVTVDIILGMLIFATIVGNVGNMISNMNAGEAEFVERLDGVKQFMEYRKCNPRLQKHVIQWFNYIWSQKQSLDEGSVLEQLPTKLKAELAIHVHMDTLKRVRIFQDCEPGLLVELVLKLKLQVFSPGDFVCRKGDIGKEMYIVKRGSLNVVGDDGTTVFVTLKEGSVFGELSILNIPGNKTGNRRSASVRSVGYADLFVLSKDDLWDALREYPEAKSLLLQKGREILKKDNLLDETIPQEEELDSETLDQKMQRLDKHLQKLESDLEKLYQNFVQQVSVNKKSITTLEHVLKTNKKLIRADAIRGLF